VSRNTERLAGRYLRFYGVSWAIRRRLSRWKQAGLPTATANLCLGGVKCAQLVAFSRTREVEVHDAPLHRRAARPDRHEVARRPHAATTYRSTPHALRARGWPVCESISPQSCHACPSASHRSVKRAPHHRPPLSPATQALPKRFAHALGPLRALYRSPASAGRTPRPLGQHPSLGRHHRQPRLSNGVSAAALRAHFRSLTYSVPSRTVMSRNSYSRSQSR